MNKVVILGRIASMKQRERFLSVSLAENYNQKNRETGEWESKPLFHSLVVAPSQVEFFNKCNIGDMLFVTGSIRYKDKYTNIIVDTVNTVFRKKKDGAEAAEPTPEVAEAIAAEALPTPDDLPF